MNLCCFLYNVFCGTNNTQTRINDLKENLEPRGDYKVKRYLNRVQHKYNKLKFKRGAFKLLRFLQVMGGFAITTMTTYNNPYFKDNTDKVNIMVWYVSISNNVFNMLIETLNAYDLTTMKVMVELLIKEGESYRDNEKDYKYYEDSEKDKLIFFQRCYADIQKIDPYDYLSENNYPRHAKREIRNGRDVRLERVWAFPVPTPPKKDNAENTENLDGTEVQEEVQYDIQDEIQGLNQPVINQPNVTCDV